MSDQAPHREKSQMASYDKDEAKRYSEGRAFGSARLDVWIDAFERSLPAKRPLRIVDVGSGTGRFSAPLARRVNSTVVALEPSEAMRNLAQKTKSSRVYLVGGEAENAPFHDKVFDAALLSYVWHQIADRDRVSRELYRILRSHGRVLLRTNVSEIPTCLWWYEHFPIAAELDRSQYAPTNVTLGPLLEVGFNTISITGVVSELAPSRSADFDRLRNRPMSFFGRLQEPDIESGFNSIAQALQSDPKRGEPVYVRQALCVLERSRS
jgi:ubiquinone/menaquinone biosynthesis C-methylase UbiE